MALSHDCYEDGVVGLGPAPADVMLIGIAPGQHEWKISKRPFSGPSGRLMDAILEYVGFQREQVYTTNLHCQWNDKPTPAEIRECMPRWIDEIIAVKPKIIVALGDIVSEFLTGQDFTAVRGQPVWHPEFRCWILCTYHPAAYIYKDSKVQVEDGIRDFRKIAWYLDKPKDFGKVTYEVAESLEHADNILDHMYMLHSMDVVAVDIETNYGKPKQLLSVAFTCEHGTYHIGRAFVNDINWASPTAPVRWTFHNGLFDSPQLKTLTGAYFPIVEDTMLMSYSLDERGGRIEETGSGGEEHGVGIHGLKRLAAEYLGAGRYTLNKSTEEMTPEELAEYNSKDSAYTYRLAQYFIPRQIEEDVRDMYLNLLIPGAIVHSKITARGAHIDRHALNRLMLEWGERWLQLEEALVAQANAVGFEGRINLKSPKQLARVIYDLMEAPSVSTKPRTTDMAALKVFSFGESDKIIPELQRFATDILTIRGLNKDIDTYGTGILDDMDEFDRIHPEPDLHGTRNGRLAYKKPPIMTIPKPRTVGAERARIRTIFAPSNPATHVIMEADFRQAELWGAWFVSKDEVLLDDLESGDFHARGAQDAFNIRREDLDPLMWELYRDSYKIVVYGSFYGAGADALVGDKALTGRGSTGSYILLKTKKEAQTVLDRFNSRYSKLYAWREAEKQYVRREGEQQSLTGRKRRYHLVRFPHQLNQAINTPISSLSHDHLMAGWIELGGYVDPWTEPVSLLEPYNSWMWFEVHDSIVLEVDKRYIKEVVNLLHSVMSKPRFGLSRGIPLDIKAGPNWLEVGKI